MTYSETIIKPRGWYIWKFHEDCALVAEIQLIEQRHTYQGSEIHRIRAEMFAVFVNGEIVPPPEQKIDTAAKWWEPVPVPEGLDKEQIRAHLVLLYGGGARRWS